MKIQSKKVVLLTLNGWGLSASFSGNLIQLANPENFNYLWRAYPHFVLKTNDGKNIRPKNPELYEQIISTGRFLPSISEYIDAKISDHSFEKNTAIDQIIEKCLKNKSDLHIIATISGDEVFCKWSHLISLLKLIDERGVKNIYIHVVCDQDAMVKKLQNHLDEIGIGKIATVVAMRNDQNAATSAYKAVTAGIGNKILDISQIEISHLPIVVYDRQKPIGNIKDFDNIIFIDTNPCFTKHLCGMFSGHGYANFRKVVYNVSVVAFVDDLNIQESQNYSVAFSRDDLSPNLSSILSDNNKTQTNLLLNVDEISNLIEVVRSNKYEYVGANISLFNPDHFQNTKEIVKTIRTVDSQLMQLENIALSHKYNLIITSGFGVLEQLSGNNISKNPVPLILITKGNEKRIFDFGLPNNLLSEILQSRSTICDISPTILNIMGVNIPSQIAGKSLIM